MVELIKACSKKKPDVNEIINLLDSGININYIDKKTGYNALMTLCQKYNKNQLELIKVLIDYGIDVGNVDIYNETPLLIMGFDIGIDQMEIIKLLIDSGADVNHVNDFGDNVLSLSLYSRNNNTITFIEFLVNYGINLHNVNIDRYDIMTLLIESQPLNLYEITSYLFQNGININHIDSRGYNHLTKIISQNEINTNCIKERVQIHIANIISRDRYLFKSNNKIIKLMLKYGANVNDSRNYIMLYNIFLSINMLEFI